MCSFHDLYSGVFIIKPLIDYSFVVYSSCVVLGVSVVVLGGHWIIVLLHAVLPFLLVSFSRLFLPSYCPAFFTAFLSFPPCGLLGVYFSHLYS